MQDFLAVQERSKLKQKESQVSSFFQVCSAKTVRIFMIVVIFIACFGCYRNNLCRQLLDKIGNEF